MQHKNNPNSFYLMNRVLLYFFPILMYSQSVYLPATHNIYEYLNKMEAKMVITGVRDAMRPLSRETVAKYLIAIDSSKVSLTDVEHDEQMFFKEEFFQELQHQGYGGIDEERWHAYKYLSDSVLLNIDLIGGFTYQHRADGKYVRVSSNGLAVYGYLSRNSGVYFNFRDNRESGSYLNYQRPLSPIPGEMPAKSSLNSFEFDPIDVQLNYDIGFGTISIEKMHNAWGEANRGTIILSNKAPSFPQLKYRAHLGRRADFVYIHGWLYSGLIDSNRSFSVAGISDILGLRPINRQKYIAAHMLEFTPWNGVDIAIGESEIYGSRNPELLYLIPFMFFKAGEHWMNDTDNSQMFANFDINLIEKFSFYSSLFVDEFSVADFTRTDRQRNQIAFTFGSRMYDIVVHDTKIVLEYTRLNPWVYSHKYTDATYQSHSLDLGHWVGQNGDIFFSQIMYQPIRNLLCGIQFESVRKGGKFPTIRQYQLPSPDFLYSPVTKYQTFGIVGRYEIVRDGVFDFHVLRSRYTDETSKGKSDYSNKYDLFVGLRYNFD